MNSTIILQQVADLISFEMKISDRVGNNTLQITKPRARQILLDIRALQKEVSKSKSKHIHKEPAWALNPY
jgi:hypothetical protein